MEHKNATKRKESDRIARNLAETRTGYTENASLNSYTYMKLLSMIPLRPSPYTLQQNNSNDLIMEIRYRI
jgi:hypothetical protein